MGLKDFSVLLTKTVALLDESAKCWINVGTGMDEAHGIKVPQLKEFRTITVSTFSRLISASRSF